MYKYENVTQENQWDIPSQHLHGGNGVELVLHSLPYSNSQNKLVYFVSGDNGDEFGQYPDRDSAFKKYMQMIALTEEERRKYDE